MLNPFPIQFLALLAYFLLRVFVGGIFFYFGFSHFSQRRALALRFTFPRFPYGMPAAWSLIAIELVVGSMFILGFYTQIAALVTMMISAAFLVLNTKIAPPYFPGRSFYILLFASSLSLFITGAGAFGFDLPI